MTYHSRTVEPEWLDALPPSDPRAKASRRDLMRLNAVMGQLHIMSGLLKTVRCLVSPRTLWDLGSGDGLFMLRVARILSKHWPSVTVALLDRQASVSPQTLAQFKSLGWTANPISADLFEFLQSQQVESPDVITANLILHHFSSQELTRLFELASQRTLIFAACEPRRAPLALAGSRLVGLLGCNAVTRHDAVASVQAGFHGKELSALWPDQPGWLLTERSAGLFTHCFMAHHAD